jgi:hypothetical protein
MYNLEYTVFPLVILNFLLCSNVHFTLIGFGDATLSYPAVYTTGGKINFEGKYSHQSLSLVHLNHIQNRTMAVKVCNVAVCYL